MMELPRLQSALCVLGALFPALACAWTAAGEGEVDRARELVARYDGTWEGEIQTFETAWSKAGTQRWAIENRCSPVGEFYACRQRFNDGSPTLTVYSFAGDGTHSSVVLDLQGRVVQSGSLTARGDTLFFPWQAAGSDGTRHHFRVVNTWRGSDCIEFRKEFSDDDEVWHVIASGLERRATRRDARCLPQR